MAREGWWWFERQFRGSRFFFLLFRPIGIAAYAKLACIARGKKQKIDLPSTRHEQPLESNRETTTTTTTNRKASEFERAIGLSLWPHGNWLAFIFALRATEA